MRRNCKIKILIITDAWHPQINGVVTTLTELVKGLESKGHSVRIIHPWSTYGRIPLPYNDVQISLVGKRRYWRDMLWADAIHIATPEGLVGGRGVKFCKRWDLRFTTGYHTKWPEYINTMFPWVKREWVERYMKKIHQDSDGILVPTITVLKELTALGFKHVKVWTRGTDKSMYKFYPEPDDYIVCVSRVNAEKNLEAFFKINGRKIMVGDGPMLSKYKKQYPDVEFVGAKRGAELVEYFGKAKCFVFPSLTDTFGLVMIEAMSCGTPVAAYPVTGPIDVVEPLVTGILHTDLQTAVDQASLMDRKLVYEGSKEWNWEVSVAQFIDILVINT